MQDSYPKALCLTACAIVRRAGVKLPTVTVCFKDLNVSTTVYVGSRALPSTLNAYRNFIEVQNKFS